MVKNALEMQQVYKSYKKNEILQNVNFSIPQGAICGLIGENGAGKSTIMKLIAGTSYVSSGSIYIMVKMLHREIRKKDEIWDA